MISDDLPELKAKLLAAIEERELTEHRDLIVKHSEPCVVLEESDHESAIGETRIGGLPDLPPDVAWPEDEGKKLPFIAQLDLASLPRWEGMPLPAEGWLWFFSLQYDDVKPLTVILHHAGPRSALQRATEPTEDEVHPDWGGERIYRAVAVSLSLSASFDVDAVVDAAAVDDEDSDELEDALFDLRDDLEAEADDEAAGQVLGFPTISTASVAEIARQMELEGSDWMQVLELNSVGSMQWGDAGTLNVLVTRAGLDAEQFSEAAATIWAS